MKDMFWVKLGVTGVDPLYSTLCCRGVFEVNPQQDVCVCVGVYYIGSDGDEAWEDLILVSTFTGTYSIFVSCINIVDGLSPSPNYCHANGFKVGMYKFYFIFQLFLGHNSYSHMERVVLL